MCMYLDSKFVNFKFLVSCFNMINYKFCDDLVRFILVVYWMLVRIFVRYFYL